LEPWGRFIQVSLICHCRNARADASNQWRLPISMVLNIMCGFASTYFRGWSQSKFVCGRIGRSKGSDCIACPFGSSGSLHDDLVRNARPIVIPLANILSQPVCVGSHEPQFARKHGFPIIRCICFSFDNSCPDGKLSPPEFCSQLKALSRKLVHLNDCSPCPKRPSEKMSPSKRSCSS